MLIKMVLFLFFTIFSLIQISATKDFVCRTKPHLSNIECLIQFSYMEENVIPECKVYGKNDMAVTIGIKKQRESLSNLSFTCMSDTYLGVSKIGFKDGQPQEKFTDIRLDHQEHINSFNLSEATYRLTISLPNGQFIFYTGVFVEYSIFNSRNYDDELKVAIEFYNAEPELVRDVCRTYNLQGDFPIDIYKELETTIPVVTFSGNEDQYIKHLRMNYSGLEVTYGMDGSNIFYDPTHGVHIVPNWNPSVFKDSVAVSNYLDCDFPIYKLRMIGEYFRNTRLHLFGSKFNYILQNSLRPKRENSITVSCSSGNSQPSIRPLILSDRPRFVSNNYSVGVPPNERFYATAEIFYMTKEEIINSTVGNYLYDNVVFGCFNTSISLLGTWLVTYDRKPPTRLFRYNPESNEFVCKGMTYIHQGEGTCEESVPVLRHWACNNIFECQTVADYCLQDGEYKPEWRFYPCSPLLSDKCENNPRKTNCMTRIQGSSIPCGSQENDDSSCVAIIPAKKGIVQCRTLLEDDVDVEYQRMYFEGFDGIVYVETEEEPPLEAKLKITRLHTQTEYFYTGKTFQFRCEGHSFFYSGLQLFFKYSNGSILPPHIENTEYITVEHQDRSNPEINALFRFERTDIEQILCYASLLNSKEWEHIVMNLSIHKSTVPEITNSEPVHFLTEDDNEQMMNCQTSGIPLPEITWERFVQPIKEPLKILPGGILVFPGYNESFLGNYTCHAISFNGKTSATFVVEKMETEGSNTITNTNQRNDYLYYIIGAVSAVFAAVAFLIYRYINNSNNRQRYRELKDVISLLEGVIKNSNPGYEHLNPVNLPFDQKYELQKDAFLIDRSVLLGTGEFSEVYKGHINGVDKPVAFKSLKPCSPIEHLKALASELKILMYIGPHENIVALLGAYKKEVEKGVLYVAVELCSRGSLEIFLRKNKHRFITHFQRPFEENINTEEASTENLELNRLISIKSLVNWSTQIAKGMAYLTTKRVIHSDLATRNVLLTADGTAKLTDFGLSRRIYKYTSEYVKTGNEPLPWKWLAPECLMSHTYSVKSDVWAYGITLFEIFSIGDVPYPGTSYSFEFIQRLSNGMRAEKPKYATNEIYDLINQCCQNEPNKRPKFEYLINYMDSVRFDDNHVVEQIQAYPTNAGTSGYVQLI